MQVITLTGNLLAEWTFDLPSFERGQTQRADAMSFQVGGKGNNVARLLQRFGEDTTALAFASGAMGAFCSDWLERRSLPHKFFPLEDGVRPGLVVRETERDADETTFLGQDLPVPAASWKAACQFTEQSRPDWLAICGSIPGWSKAWTRSIGSILERGIKVVADTYGPPLADLVGLPLDLVKINRTELEKLFPQKAGEETFTILAAARRASPVKNWVITDGPRAIRASLASGENRTVTPADIREVSPTGSGDTFLAAILHKWPDGPDLREALAFATACASANAASPGIGDFPLPVPERFLPEID